MHTLAPVRAEALEVNHIGQVVLRLAQPLPLQPHAASRVGGALIVVDPASHCTSGALLASAASA
jgi:sulfate adenylyltransferase subunit 1